MGSVMPRWSATEVQQSPLPGTSSIIDGLSYVTQNWENLVKD
jgi:hypothetical protein